MTEHAAPADPAEPEAAEETLITPRSDLIGGLLWMFFGVAVLAASVGMDRLERQNINPYTAPGLLPGLLGIAMILLGSILALRSWRRGALHAAATPDTADQRERRRRIAVVTALCLGYGVVLVGHGLPFWAASTVFVSGSILILRRMSRDVTKHAFTARAVTMALVIGVCASVITHVVFQELFLVRLP